MKKLSHSKYRNTGLIFELLIHQITADTLSEEEKSTASNILDEYFKNTILEEENKMYQILVGSNRSMSHKRARALIEHVIEKRKNLDNDELESIKYDLVGEIKEEYGLNPFFKTRIDKYKEFASVYKLFEAHASDENIRYNKSDINECVNTVTSCITNRNNKGHKERITFLEKQNNAMRNKAEELMMRSFNQKYGRDLNRKQRQLVEEYVRGVSRTNDFVGYMIKEAEHLQDSLDDLLYEVNDRVISIKLDEAIDLLEKIRNQSRNSRIKDSHVSQLMMYYELENRLNEMYR